MHTNRTHTLHW